MKNLKTLTEEEKGKIVYLYTVENKGMSACGKVIGISQALVKKVLLEKNVHVRTQQESVVLKNKINSYNKNENYFSIESHNMAWILGFLASDGSVALKDNKIKIGLSIKDKEILEKIKEEIQIENPIKTYTTTAGYDCCELSWTCGQHKKDLAKYSIIPQKTFRLKPPTLLNKKYWIDYIRGYFDGDGSVNLIKNSNARGNGNLRWQICSATKDILEFIIDFFEEQYNIPKVSILSVNKSNRIFYYFQYSSVSTRKIYDILYTPNSLFLKRKKEHFEEILQRVAPLNDIKSHEPSIPFDKE